MTRQTIAQVKPAALRHNLQQIKRLAPRSRVMAVVKADAYGHGLSRVLPALQQSDAFAVATLSEAQRVRASGWDDTVVLLEGFNNPDGLRRALDLDLDLVIHHKGQIDVLQGQRHTLRRRLWLKLDSGMHRLGFPLAEAERRFGQLQALSAQAVGLMTHFACADQADNSMTREQADAFYSAVRQLDGPCSLANSAALLHFPETHADWVRPGIALYGISPTSGSLKGDGFKPAMRLVSELIAVKPLAAGQTVGYGATYTASTPITIGVAAIGYGDGYPWSAPNGTPVRVNGQPATLVGRVSMDMIGIDLSGVPNPAIGDTVELWGDALPVEAVAAAVGTIPYELVTRVGARVRYETV